MRRQAESVNGHPPFMRGQKEGYPCTTGVQYQDPSAAFFLSSLLAHRKLPTSFFSIKNILEYKTIIFSLR